MPRIVLILLLLIPPATGWTGETRHTRDPDTGLETWEASSPGIAVRLTQITPDQAHAFFQARGFPAADAEHFAAACVFMSVVRNTGTAPLSFDLREWRYRPAGGSPLPMLAKEDWLAQWQARGLAEPARIAFAWAQIPTEQTYEPGDWNQGMTSYRVPRGGTFDLHYVWHSEGKTHEDILRGARCAEDSR